MQRPDDPVCEVQIDDRAKQIPDRHEQTRCDCETGVLWMRRPRYAQHTSSYAGHGKSEQSPGHVELVPSPFVQLKESEVASGPEKE